MPGLEAACMIVISSAPYLRKRHHYLNKPSRRQMALNIGASRNSPMKPVIWSWSCLASIRICEDAPYLAILYLVSMLVAQTEKPTYITTYIEPSLSNYRAASDREWWAQWSAIILLVRRPENNFMGGICSWWLAFEIASFAAIISWRLALICVKVFWLISK